MMAEYIDRDELYEQMHVMGMGFDLIEALEMIENFPAADVAPVVHGKWVEYPRAHYFKCSNCKYTVPHRKANLFNGKREYNYCPHCGAKMDG